MSTLFDPFNLFMLGVVLIVFWRLRSVLGSRTGHERPPFDPFSTRTPDDKANAPAGADGKVLRFPRQAEEEKPVGIDRDPPPPVWYGYAPEGSPVAQGLLKISEADPSFTPKSFLEGAKIAYEMTVEAFASGDKAALKPLLSRDVLDSFSGAIDQRNSEGQKIEQRFVGIDKAELGAVTLKGKKAHVTVKFVSEIISATYGRDGAIIDGDPKQIREISDVWTFERDVSSADPNWKIISTQGEA